MSYKESEVYSMIKNKEQLIKDKSNQVTAKVKEYINNLDALSDTSDFTIDNIEAMLGEIENETRQIFTQTNDEMIQQMNEKELIRKKKGSTLKKGSF